MTTVTVTPNAMPTPGTYAEMLESLLAELGFDRALTGKIANTIEYDMVGLDRLYELIDSILATDSFHLMRKTLNSFYKQMANDSDNWSPTTANIYRSADEYQRMVREHPALERACHNLDRLISELTMSYYSH